MEGAPLAQPALLTMARGAGIPFLGPGQEQQIPLLSFDLQRYLLADSTLTPPERNELRKFSELLREILHREFLSWIDALLDLYSPLDPDSEVIPIQNSSLARSDGSDETFLKAFETVLLRANFRELKSAEVMEAIRAPNELGLNYEPNFELFEHLKVFVRGRTKVKRTVRKFRSWFRSETVELHAFRRLVVVVKFRQESKLDSFVRSDVVYVRLFKDVPFVDMEMHLPEQGTKIRMRPIDKAQIASPLIVGLPAIASQLFTVIPISPMAIAGVLFAPISAGVKSFFGFRQAKEKHLHRMIRHLYYLTLANNVGVLHWLGNAAEEEDFKEVLLAYWFLNRNRDDPQRCTLEAVDREIEALLLKLTNRPINFDAEDALQKLQSLGLVMRAVDGVYSALTVQDALRSLDEQWDNYFQYSQPGRAAETQYPD